MYAIDEITVENQQNFFARLYLYLAKGLYETCGRAGEGAVREAVRRFGAARGEELRRRHREAGLKTNVRSFALAGDCLRDTRERGEMLHLEDEVCLREVYTCPRADLWRKYGAGAVGLWYCEECQSAMFRAYTAHRGQPNLSERLTCERENHCRFSLYYRRANADPQEAEAAFGKGRDCEGTTDAFALGIGELCARLYIEIRREAESRFGAEGLCAVANALRSLAQEEAEVMLRQARYTLNPCDGQYLRENFPLPLCAEELAALVPDKAEAEMLLTNLLSPMLARIGIGGKGQ